MIDFSKYKTTSTGIDFSKYTSKEKKPVKKSDKKSDTREVGLPDYLGGGRYLTNDSGDLFKSPRSQSALGDTKEGSERDHIISVALGGVSTRENLQYLATTEEGRQAGKVSVEQKAINDYTSGKISLGEARGLIATKQQQIKGFTPTEREQTTKGQLIPAIKGLPKTIWGKIQSIGDFIENALPSKGSIIENIAAKSASEVLGREIDPVNYASQIKDLSIEDKQLIQQRTTDSIKESVTGDINVARNVISAIGQSAFSSKFKEQRGEAFKKGTLQSAAALTSTLAKGVETLGMIDFSNKLKSIAEKDLQGVIYINNLKKKGIVVEDNRKFSEKIQDPNFITEGLFQSLPNMLFAMGVGLPALAVSAPGAVVAGTIFGATATLEGGFAYNEAKQQGATEDEATKAATITGIANGILEGLPIFKLFTRNPAIKRLKQSFIKKVVNNIVQQFKRAKSQSLAEGVTESLEEVVSNSAARVYDENRSIFSGADESFFFGALVGGGMSIGMDVIQSTKNLPVGMAIKDVSLEAEAKKFKTADEFVKAQPKLYHGTTEKFDKFDTSKVGRSVNDKEGIFFTNNKDLAERYTYDPFRDKRGGVMEVVVDIKKPLEVEAGGNAVFYFQKNKDSILKKAKKGGYDGIKVYNKDGGENVIIALSANQTKTTQELTDIWNKANKK